MKDIYKMCNADLIDYYTNLFVNPHQIQDTDEYLDTLTTVRSFILKKMNKNTPAPVNAESEVNCDIVKKFHDERLLFIVIGNKVFAEKTPSGLSHVDWVKTLDISDTKEPYCKLDVCEDYNSLIDKCTRGYYHNNKLVLYKGMDFRCDSTVIDTIRYQLSKIVVALNLDALTKVGVGVIPEKDSIFKVKYQIGTIKGLTHTKDFSRLYKKCRNS